MIQTVVSNASAPEYGQATISFPIREEDYPSVVNMLQRMGLGNLLERDCRVDEVSGDWPILKRLEKVAINLDEMDYLAKRLDSFDRQEKAKFQAAAVRFGLFDMRHLIDLTFCCQETTVITDSSDLEKVGRRHYLDVNGGSASSEELENVDGYETALLLIGDGEGIITPYGVIYDNGMQLRPVYDGQNFPLYQDRDSVFLLGLSHKSELSMNSATTWVFLPASVERLERALTIDEEVLKEAILSAVNQMMSSRDELTGQLINAMKQELIPLTGQGLSISDIDRALEDLSIQFDQLLKEASLSADSTENAEKFRRISTAMTDLKERRTQMEKLHHENEQVYRRVKAAEAALSETAAWITEWKEDALYQLLEKVTVLDETRIKVTFRSGVEIEQVLEKVERSVTA